MKRSLQAAVAAAALVLAGHAAAQITFYEREGFQGRAFTTGGPVRNMDRVGFGDRASSVVVDRGRWEICEYPRFEGRCVLLRRGQYPALRQFGMNNRVSSVRPVDERRHGRWEEPPPGAPVAPVAGGEWQRRPSEVLHEVPVTSARAIVGPPNQQCWLERQQVAEPPRSDANIGGAVVGGLVGGILGHQIGGGSGKDLATAGGAVAGAVIGSRVGPGGAPGGVAQQDVQRCRTVPNTRVDYWDVTYQWRGVQHHVQMSAPPGRTLLVNDRGEPRQ